MKNADKIRTQIISEYRKAFCIGTDRAWRKYYKILDKLTKELDADSPEVLEDWAFMTSEEAQ